MNWSIKPRLNTVRESFESSGNPWFVWNAINDCIKTNTRFPNWIVEYLGRCSGRMLSDKAQQTSDLGRILPWVFGFPTKRGPRNLGHPGYAEFLIKFGRLIVQGQDPVTARRDACNAVFDGKNAEVDDKTLVRWVKKGFSLKEAPRNTKQWKEVARKNLVHLLAIRARLRSATTRAEMDEIIALVKEIPELSALAKQIPKQWTKSRETLS
jgi:hypothetical protein